MKKITIQQIRNIFPNAHSEWVIILKKRNGTKNIKAKKKEREVDLWPMVQAVQIKQA